MKTAHATLFTGMMFLTAQSQPLQLERVRGFNRSETSTSHPLAMYADAKDFGANVVRLHIWNSAIPKPFWTHWPGFLDELDNRVARCRTAGLKVIINVNFSPFDDSQDVTAHAFWTRPDLASAYARVWTDIAGRLGKFGPVIYAYDLFNEPVDYSVAAAYPTQWRPLAVKLVEAIRKVDKNVWIIYESGPGSRVGGFKDLVPLPDRKIIYGGHWYQAQLFTHQGVSGNPVGVPYPAAGWNRAAMVAELKVVRDFQLRYDVPIFMGEFSVSDKAPLADAQRWYDDVLSLFEEYKWSWAYHEWRGYPGWDLEKMDPSLIQRVQGNMRRNGAGTVDTYNPRIPVVSIRDLAQPRGPFRRGALEVRANGSRISIPNRNGK